MNKKRRHIIRKSQRKTAISNLFYYTALHIILHIHMKEHFKNCPDTLNHSYYESTLFLNPSTPSTYAITPSTCL